MIGNGLTDFFTQIYSGYDFGCSVYPFLSIDQCVKLKQLIPRCKRWTQSSCIDTFDMVDTYCNEELWAFVYDDLGWNPYDIRRKCEGDIEETLCYPEVSPKLTAYLNHPSTRQKLGVDLRFIGKNYTTCSADVGSQFVFTLDYARPTYHYVGALLERGVRVLTYVGNYDWLCNWVGVEAWTLALEWSGKDAFGREELREWEVDGKIAGFVRSFSGFTFVTIDGAGHMAPYDKPKESLALVQRWLVKEEI
ncbi:hypothetical protein D9756_004412 [Leucocoprinus leucothites]|uniref:carboxypeptidase C n=1 Tax=Leucocoprinus leucothites TaxID=201217 RepID=A0A8H5D9C3_9AGAR|nr:hypothetical protein D9756_004412 [Leucoagaricus leucothites]